MRPLYGWLGALTAGIVLLSSCSTARPGTHDGVAAAGDAFPPPYERVITAFPVLDSLGRAYDMPFLGGLNVPRPQFADIDADGDLDLFVQEWTGEVMFFERIGEGAEARYVWRTDQYRDLDIGEWYRFVDMDDDGDLDLLGEQRFSHIRYFRNEGTPEAARFVLAIDSLRDDQGKPIFSDRQNIPNLTDIDCDGNLDLFIGRLDGTVMRYEASTARDAEIPRFRLITERFEDIEIVAELQMGSLHGANTLTFADVDGDGDQDLFWGDFFEAGLLFIKNTGSCASPVLRGEPTAFPLNDPVRTSGYNDPAFADLDGDGDRDLVIGVLGGAFNPVLTSADNFYHYERLDDGTYDLVTRRFLYGLDVGSESIPAFADLDGDGDLDLLLSNKISQDNFQSGHIHYLENTGTAAAPAFAMRSRWALPDAFHNAPALADLDADGDLDILMGKWKGEVDLYLNQGTAQAPDFVLEAEAYVKLTRGSNSTPALVDIDGDGDLDLFIGESSGTLNFYRNEGTPAAPQFELVSDTYLDIDVGRRSFPTFVDIDGDGDQDMVLGTDAEGLMLYRNTGTPTAPAFTHDPTYQVPVPDIAAPAYVDIDADGDLDLFTGGLSGGLILFLNQAINP